MNPAPESKNPRVWPPSDLLLDDFGGDDVVSALATRWRGFSDRVMGGVSRESVVPAEIDGRRDVAAPFEEHLLGGRIVSEYAFAVAPPIDGTHPGSDGQKSGSCAG